ncbi:hypothetical protein A5643_15160 [Mycobacterium sp. 1274756.6]|nr:hypothetical protein A5643_15160 [Mycobacterium sp. 1274756.6]
MDGEAMKNLWDRSYPGLIYQAEENAEALAGWDEIERYWDTAPTLVDRVSGFEDLGFDVSEVGGAVILFGRVSFDIFAKGFSKPISGGMRMTMVLHVVDGELKLIHYHESRQLDLTAALS